MRRAWQREWTPDGRRRANGRYAEAGRQMEREDEHVLARDRDDSADWCSHVFFCPPWRERLSDGRLGPEYGPLTPDEWERQWGHYNESFHGLGLWDFSEDKREAKREERRMVERYDARRMDKFMRRQSHEVPTRECEVYALFYGDGLSMSRVARRLGTSKKTAEGHLLALRRRLREWTATRYG